MRFCPLCQKRSVYTHEDEFHFVCICPFYNELRLLYCKQQWKTGLTTVSMFYHIMLSDDKDSTMAIARYLVSAFAHRSELLQSET